MRDDAGDVTAVEAFFGWPTGGVWANLLSSLICLALGYVWGRRAARKIHDKIAALHSHVSALGGKVDDNHAAVLLHVTTSVNQAHDGAIAGMCQAITAERRPCRNPAKYGTTRCPRHPLAESGPPAPVRLPRNPDYTLRKADR